MPWSNIAVQDSHPFGQTIRSGVKQNTTVKEKDRFIYKDNRHSEFARMTRISDCMI